MSNQSSQQILYIILCRRKQVKGLFSEQFYLRLQSLLTNGDQWFLCYYSHSPTANIKWKKCDCNRSVWMDPNSHCIIMKAYRVAQQNERHQAKQQSTVLGSLHLLQQSDIPVVSVPWPSTRCPLCLATIKNHKLHLTEICLNFNFKINDRQFWPWIDGKICGRIW